MSDWRNWARVIGGVIIAVVVFSVFMNILGDYRAAKDAQNVTEQSRPSTGPASSVTQTGRPPLNPPATTSGSGTAATKAPTSPATPSKTAVVIVVVDGVNLRNGPSTTADVIRALKKNERLAYFATKNGYYQVRDDAGTSGWVSSNRDYTRLESTK
jgi:Bacterial SH3 domain